MDRSERERCNAPALPYSHEAFPFKELAAQRERCNAPRMCSAQPQITAGKHEKCGKPESGSWGSDVRDATF